MMNEISPFRGFDLNPSFLNSRFDRSSGRVFAWTHPRTLGATPISVLHSPGMYKVGHAGLISAEIMSDMFPAYSLLHYFSS